MSITRYLVYPLKLNVGKCVTSTKIYNPSHHGQVSSNIKTGDVVLSISSCCLCVTVRRCCTIAEVSKSRDVADCMVKLLAAYSHPLMFL